MKHDVQIFRGAEIEAGVFHRQSGRRAADQYELIGVAGKVFPKHVEPLHHGKCSVNSPSAS